MPKQKPIQRLISFYLLLPNNFLEIKLFYVT